MFEANAEIILLMAFASESFQSFLWRSDYFLTRIHLHASRLSALTQPGFMAVDMTLTTSGYLSERS